jgi:hypothetical protein
MAQEEQHVFQPRYLTIAEVWELYQQHDQPLNADTIRATLEPLAGTSFLTHATEILHITKPGEPIHALDLYLIFNGAFDDLEACTTGTQAVDAAACLYALSSFRVPLEMIHTMKWMAADELLAREQRCDYLYYDPDKTRPAGWHTATQFRFYKAGTHRRTLSVSQIEYQDETGTFHSFTQLSEGILTKSFFSDAHRPPLPFVDPRQSRFFYTLPLVCISPQFSIAEAQPRPRS